MRRCILEVWVASKESPPFNPQILVVATSGAANTCIDDPKVFGVWRLEFPPSILDVKQEKGHAGRCPHIYGAPSWLSDWYLLCISLESYVVLLKKHLHNTPVTNKKTSYFKAFEGNKQDCLEVFVLPRFCLQAMIELKMANPYLFGSACPTTYLDACTYCLGHNILVLFPRGAKENNSFSFCWLNKCNNEVSWLILPFLGTPTIVLITRGEHKIIRTILVFIMSSE
jgi:hypothetical protein